MHDNSRTAVFANTFHTPDLWARPLAPGPSDQGYAVGRYLEHLEEASFLYEQRVDGLHDPEVTWLDLGDFEQRFEAHLDALMVGEDLALAVCTQQTVEGDYGELHAAVRIFCRYRRLDLVQDTLDGLDPDDAERVQAVADALCHELPAAWQAPVMDMLSREDALRSRLAARIAGYRRLPVGKQLARGLAQEADGTLTDKIWALGRLRYTPAREVLYERYLHHDEEAVCAASALALLRMGEPQAVQFCSVFARSQSWTHVPLGLGGSRSDVRGLLALASSNGIQPDTLLALGLLGDVSAVEALLYQMADDTLAEAAATALYLLTGAPLYEEAFLPDEIDEDELFDEERETLEQEGTSTPPDEQPPGTTITRLSLKREEWQAWWMKNQGRFQSGIRYRIGKPYTPAGLLETLTADTNLHQVRRWACEELVIRYGMDVPLEVDMMVAQQQEALAQCAAWVATHGSSFKEGKWYFAGTVAAW